MACFHFSLLAAVLLILTLALGASRSASQKGFYSINCGGEAYTDPTNQIIWEADPLNNSNVEFGASAIVRSNLTNITNVMKSLRYFPNDNKRNRKFCYLIRVFNKGTYLLRVSFLYGNYDGQNKPPKFLLILNYDEWTNITFSASFTPISHELTFYNNDNNDWNICLAPHFGSNDIPFISAIEIRYLNQMYTDASTPPILSAINRGYGLMLWRRIDYGAGTKSVIRYPKDPYDRIWEANTTGPTVSINASNNYTKDNEEPPAAVMETAITSTDPQGNLSFTYDDFGGTNGFRIEMHFEVDAAELSSAPEIGITFPTSNLVISGLDNITLKFSNPKDVALDLQLQIPRSFQMTIFPLPGSPRAPLLNAIELFQWTPQPLSTNGTFQGDVEAVKDIQKYFKLSGNGQGDPCMPKGYEWTWIECSINVPPRIIAINLSSLNLIGGIPSSINNLTKLQKIDLSNNNLHGEIPNVNLLLDLTYLDFHNNTLSGELPSSLTLLPNLAMLDVSYNNLCGKAPTFEPRVNFTHTGNKRHCNDVECHCNVSNTTNLPKRNNNTRKYIVSIILLGAFYVVSLLALLAIYKARQYNVHSLPVDKTVLGVDDLKALSLISKMFTYNEICDATLNFTTILGEGGFGQVYHGLLLTGEAIAVKRLADASKQRLKEFQNEVAILSKVRHKNLVSLIGYCVENSYMLIYEYIPKGNLRDLIYGEVESPDKPLSWTTRLHIALDASQGLEYLHTGCDTAIIHRDVKSNNILLSDKLQAKVADFGLSRLKEGDNNTSHVSTINVVGTVGYLDPEYNATFQLTDKSDVYSFGVVLLELICGRAPIDMFNDPPHIIDWASQSIMQGKVHEIVDPTLANGYKMESMWKVVDLALGCVETDRTKRPKMSKVVELLQSALEIEVDPNYSQDVSGSSSTSHGKLPIFHKI